MRREALTRSEHAALKKYLKPRGAATLLAFQLDCKKHTVGAIKRKGFGSKPVILNIRLIIQPFLKVPVNIELQPLRKLTPDIIFSVVEKELHITHAELTTRSARRSETQIAQAKQITAYILRQNLKECYKRISLSLGYVGKQYSYGSITTLEEAMGLNLELKELVMRIELKCIEASKATVDFASPKSYAPIRRSWIDNKRHKGHVSAAQTHR